MALSLAEICEWGCLGEAQPSANPSILYRPCLPHFWYNLSLSHFSYYVNHLPTKVGNTTGAPSWLRYAQARTPQSSSLDTSGSAGRTCAIDLLDLWLVLYGWMVGINGHRWIPLGHTHFGDDLALVPGLRTAEVSNFLDLHWHHTGYVLHAFPTTRCLPRRPGAGLVNIVGTRWFSLINKAAIIWSLAGASTICIVCLACASGEYQPPSFVFAQYINETGWNGGVAWVRRSPTGF